MSEPEKIMALFDKRDAWGLGIGLVAVAITAYILIGDRFGSENAEVERFKKEMNEKRNEERKATDDRERKLQEVAFGVEGFVKDFGCAPLSVDDLRAKPSAARLKELRCTRDEAKSSEHEYIRAKVYDDVRTWVRFVKRWDGLYALAWDESTKLIDGEIKYTKYCAVLDAQYRACPSFRV